LAGPPGAGGGRRQLRGAGVRGAFGHAGGRARALCPDLVFRPPRFEVYRAVSQQIRAIFLDYTPDVEPLSLDEAYLDVTRDLRGIGSATRIAELIRQRIRHDTGLTASAGFPTTSSLPSWRATRTSPMACV
jgi:DNA polymerase-4